MIAIATLLVAFPAGFFFRSRTTAVLAYVAAFSYCFTFQGMYLLPMFTAEAGADDWPRNLDKLPLSYLAVSAAVYAVGFGLVALGHKAGSKRRAGTEKVALVAVDEGSPR